MTTGVGLKSQLVPLTGVADSEGRESKLGIQDMSISTGQKMMLLRICPTDGRGLRFRPKVTSVAQLHAQTEA